MRIKSLPKNLKRMFVCIDSANVAIGLRNRGLALDYKKFLEAIKKYGQITAVYYYGPKFTHESHQKFLTFLKKLGCRLRTKPVKVIKDQLGDHRKANFDVELAIDVVDFKDTFDTLVLLSGDSDFAALASYLRRQRKKTYVLSTRGSVAKELIEESDGYVVLSEWKGVVRPYRKKSPRR